MGYFKLAFALFCSVLSAPILADSDHKPLTSAAGLVPHNVNITPQRYRGFDAVKLQVIGDFKSPREGGCEHCTFANIRDIDFTNGSIEIELTSRPVDGAPPWAKGFVGIVFRVSEDGSQYEGIYLRPVNASAADQLQRNHTVQYFSYPDYPWHRLREVSPGVYETYADIETGNWTRLKLEVRGAQALLYINGSKKPALIVNDLKLGEDASGSIGLYTEPATEAYFRNLIVTHAER